MTPLEEAQLSVYAATLKTLLPKLYSIIDRMLDGPPDKALIVEARKLLPKTYKHSFEKPKEQA
jgi:hypothetical protein